MTMTEAKPPLDKERLSFLVEIRREKWQQIDNLEKSDAVVIKGYIAFITLTGTLLAWLGGKEQLMPKLRFGFLYAMLALLSLYGISSILRNYVKHLRALKTIAHLEWLIEKDVQAFIPSNIAFRQPRTVWQFTIKLVFSTRGSILLIFLTFPLALALLCQDLCQLSQSTLYLPFTVLVILSTVLIYRHHRSFNRLPSCESGHS